MANRLALGNPTPVSDQAALGIETVAGEDG